MIRSGVVTVVAVVALIVGCGERQSSSPTGSNDASPAPRQGSWLTEGFDAFSKGTFDSAGKNLYVSKSGRLQMINVWDLNHDGNVDLFFAQSHDHDLHQPARVYFQREGQPRQDALMLLPSEAAVGELISDLNGDGFNDLVLLNAKNALKAVQDAYVYWGRPEGLTPKFRSGVPVYQGLRIFAADLDADGRKELVSLNDARKIAGKTDGFVAIHWHTEHGFSNLKRTAIPTPTLVDGDLADITGDGKPDLVLVVKDGDQQSLMLMLGISGGFDSGKPLTTSDAVSKVRLIKLSDGWIVAAISKTAIQLHTLAGGALQPSRRIELAGVVELATGDFDNDQRADVVCIDPKGVHCLSAATDFDLARAIVLPVENARAVAVGDVSGDGRQDLAVAVYKGSEKHATDSRVYLNNGTGFDPNRFVGLPTSAATSVSIADLDHDGKQDVAFACNMGGRVGYAMPAAVYYGTPKDELKSARHQELPAFSSAAGCIADFNDDGFGDLFIANEYEGSTDPQQDSRIYWGAQDGLSPTRFAAMRSKNASIPLTADINRDGYLDLIVSSYENAPTYVYWGGADGYSLDRTQAIDLPEVGLPTLADINKDGWLDLVFPMFVGKESYILFGDQSGFSVDRKVVLPMEGGVVAEAADLDSDGWLDLVMLSHWPLNTNLYHRPLEMVPSYIWWGSDKGYSAYRRTEFILPGLAIDVSVSDLNKDGYLDLVAAIYHMGDERTADSYILWGAKDRAYGLDRVTRLREDSAAAVTVADYNNDGWPDICFANHVKLGKHDVFSRVHWNRKGAFTDADAALLATTGPHEGLTVDLGNSYDRLPQESYISAPFEKPAGARFTRLSWQAKTEFGSSIAFQVRTASTRDGLETAKWTGPRGEDSEFRDSRSSLSMLSRDAAWIQYRAMLQTKNGAATPILTRVAIDYE